MAEASFQKVHVQFSQKYLNFSFSKIDTGHPHTPRPRHELTAGSTLQCTVADRARAVCTTRISWEARRVQVAQSSIGKVAFQFSEQKFELQFLQS